jgi:hypothetical protein
MNLIERLMFNEIIFDQLRNGEIRLIPMIDLHLKDLDVHFRSSESFQEVFREKGVAVHRIEMFDSRVDHRRFVFSLNEEFVDLEMSSNVMILNEDVELIEAREGHFQIMKGTKVIFAPRLTNLQRIDVFVAFRVPTSNDFPSLSFQFDQTFFSSQTSEIDLISSNTRHKEQNTKTN